MQRVSTGQIDVDRADLAWLAGLLEGEGTFMAGPPSSPGRPVLAVEMTDEDVIARAARLMGRKPFTGRAREAHWKRPFSVRVTGARAVAWMVALRPMMGCRRQAQIDRAVASYAPSDRWRLDDAGAREALTMLAAGVPVREVAESFDATVWCIYDLRGGRTFRHLPRPAQLRSGV